MMPQVQPGAHITDGDLVRLLDHEAGTDEEAIEAHLHGCERCRIRLQLLEGRSARLSQILAAADWDIPLDAAAPVGRETRIAAAPATPFVGRRWLRHAAILAGLISLGALTSPAGASLARWIATQWEGLVGGRAAAPAAAGEGILEEMAAARLSFTASAEILIEFASHQEAGGITLEVGDGAEVTVAVISGANGIDLLVRPGGVRIQNDAGTTADYRVQLPAESQLVRIRIGSDPPIELRTAELLDELYLELGKH